MSTGRFLGGLLIGGALGAVIGMLVAPRRGEETREMIRDEFSNRVNQGLDEVRYRTGEFKDMARERAENFKERAGEMAQEMEEAGRATWEKVRTSTKTRHEESHN